MKAGTWTLQDLLEREDITDLYIDGVRVEAVTADGRHVELPAGCCADDDAVALVLRSIAGRDRR